MEGLSAGITALVLATSATAQEHRACQDVDYRYLEHPYTELREIAQDCTSPAMTELNLARARHAELVADHEILNGLQRMQRSRSDWSTQEDRVFLDLVQVFSAAYDLTIKERLSVLNAAFDHVNEIAELRLKGYDLQADRLREAGVSLPEMRSLRVVD